MSIKALCAILIFALLCGCSRSYEVTLSVVTGKSSAEIERASELDGFGSHWEVGTTYFAFLTDQKIWNERILPKVRNRIHDPEAVRQSIKLSKHSSRDEGRLRITEMRLEIVGRAGDDLPYLTELLAENIEHFTRMYWGETYAPYVREIRPNQ